jgi:hypothetical protein
MSNSNGVNFAITHCWRGDLWENDHAGQMSESHLCYLGFQSMNIVFNCINRVVVTLVITLYRLLIMLIDGFDSPLMRNRQFIVLGAIKLLFSSFSFHAHWDIQGAC